MNGASSPSPFGLSFPERTVRVIISAVPSKLTSTGPDQEGPFPPRNDDSVTPGTPDLPQAENAPASAIVTMSRMRVTCSLSYPTFSIRMSAPDYDDYDMECLPGRRLMDAHRVDCGGGRSILCA